MAVKDVQFKLPSGSYNSLPGNTGDLTRESASAGDSIFGEKFGSVQVTLLSWAMSAGAFYKGLAGYIATVKKTGTPTSFTGESMTQVNSSQVWRIDDQSKAVWDWNTAATINDGGSPVDASNIKQINYIFGEVEFVSGFAPSGAITADGDYMPLSAVAKAQSYDLSQTADTENVTDFDTAQNNGGYAVMKPQQLTAELSLSGFYDSAQAIYQLQKDRDPFVVEINPDGNGNSLCRGIFYAAGDNLSGDVAATETEEQSFSLFVPEGAGKPFGWQHASATNLSQSLQDVLTAWEDRLDDASAKYLPEGTGNAGYEGNVIVTDVSLSGAVDGINEFSLSFEGTGALDDVTP